MVYIGRIPNLRACQAFCDYLAANNVDYQAQQDETGGYEVYVSEQNATFAQHGFSNFLQNPNQDVFLQASWMVGKPTDSSTPTNLGLNKIWHSVGATTRWIAAICTIVFVLAYFGFARQIFFALKFEWDFVEFYRWLTPAFMHLSALHLVFNLAFWWFLAARVEKVLGYQTLLIIFIIGGITPNTAQAAIVSTQFAGLSGVNYALAGFVWTCGVKYKSSSLFLPTGLFAFLIGWMLIGFANILPISMANWAHLGGLVIGIGLAFFLVKPMQSDHSINNRL